MVKILIAGAGGAPSEGVIYSLQKNVNNVVIGMGSEPADLVLSAAQRKYFVPYASEDNYKAELLKILEEERPDLVHFQNDLEIYHASLIRDEILATGVKIFMPSHDVIDTCVHKYKSYKAFVKAGLSVPTNIVINDEADLRRAFLELGNSEGKIWIRASSIGGGGKGALPTNDFEFARGWINHYNGWGQFVAAEMLTARTVTWLSIWENGNLIVSQGRERIGWTHGNRAISGVTGVTKVGRTVNDSIVNDLAEKSVRAVANTPHGIFGVDFAYDDNGVPNPTEINISRFFTTVRFFTEAGINFPEVFKRIALGESHDLQNNSVDTLPSNLLWVRGMDTEPKLLTQSRIDSEIIFL